jgi:hypothetical protein
MLNELLEGLKVTLNDENIVEDFTFSGDNVIATIGTVNGPVCAPILEFKINNPSSLTVKGQGFEISWESIQISDSQVSTIRNGKPAIYKIKGNFTPKQKERRLP